MATKKNESRKMIGKEQEAGLAAGISVENKTQKIAKGYVTELPCRQRYRGKRYIKVIYEDKTWELTEFYFRCGREIQPLPHCVPMRFLGVNKIEYQN